MKKNMSSRLRQRLTLQAEIQTGDDIGGYTRSWEDIADLWAEIIPLSGREKFFGDQIQDEITHRILLRYREGVLAGQRLVFEDRAFNIKYVANSREANESLDILAEEGVAA